VIDKFEDFLNESFGVNKYTKILTELLFKKINLELGKLILNKSLILNNYLQDNFGKIPFINDTIELKLSDHSHGILSDGIFRSGTITNLKITLNVCLSTKETLAKMIFDNNKLKEDINHEFNHVIEKYLSELNNRNNYKSWDIAKNLYIYRDSHKNMEDWDDILHMIYLSQPQEMRSRISEMYEIVKNMDINKYYYEKEIKNTKIYKECDLISKVNINLILSRMKNIYTNFNEILKEFMISVLYYNKPDYESEFIKYFNKLKNKNITLKEKLLKSYYYIFESTTYECYFEKDINWEKWI